MDLVSHVLEVEDYNVESAIFAILQMKEGEGMGECTVCHLGLWVTVMLVLGTGAGEVGFVCCLFSLLCSGRLLLRAASIQLPKRPRISGKKNWLTVQQLLGRACLKKTLLLAGAEEQQEPLGREQKSCSRTLWEENGTGSRIFGNQSLHQGDAENKGQAGSREENRASRNPKVCEGFGSSEHPSMIGGCLSIASPAGLFSFQLKRASAHCSLSLLQL